MRNTIWPFPSVVDPSPGYKEYFTGREYLVKMGDWRHNKDDEVELDGIGGVNILVKADVHRSGKFLSSFASSDYKYRR